MKGMFFIKSDIYYSKWATVVQKFQLSMTKLGTHDEIRWFDGTDRTMIERMRKVYTTGLFLYFSFLRGGWFFYIKTHFRSLHIQYFTQ